eukprot:CAMPEP_0177757874 /NCGR_PEP_ID=MMETSP0491_2-20121128/3874_1 /TAXON_ID=63592 /ORGANISM="Tetraselmis chuii, Strain PLY429" /LENGTH=260 /DNA_ID=CAMNT_0019273551 /DNA_START=61 /DNA_END=843 /DNA_ORIENTATION=-
MAGALIRAATSALLLSGRHAGTTTAARSAWRAGAWGIAAAVDLESSWCGTATHPFHQGQVLRSVSGAAMPSPSKLDEIVKLDKFKELSKEQCVALWEEFHKDTSKGRLGFVLEADAYQRFAQRAAESPLFVLPIIKSGGAFFNVLTQCQVPFVLCTSLEEFRSMGPNAPTHVTVTHYTELQESKGVVLGRADVTSASGDVSVFEANTLVSLLQSYYLEATGYLKVHTFNHDPEAFKFEEVLAEVQAVNRALKSEAAEKER